MSSKDGSLTSNTGEQLPGEALDLTAWKRHEAVTLQKVEYTLAQQVRDYAYMAAKVEAVAEVYAFVPIVLVVHGKSGKNSKLDSRSITILLHRSDNLDSASCLLSFVECFDHLSEGALPEQFDDVVCKESQLREGQNDRKQSTHIVQSAEDPLPPHSGHHHRRPFGFCGCSAIC